MALLPHLDGVLAENTLVASRYRVLFELGRGGTARVYLTLLQGPNGFNKLVVLKVLKSELMRAPEFHTLFYNEARLSSRLSHSNIVQVFETLEHAGAPAIAMEYLAGKSLYEVRQRAPGLFSVQVELHVLVQALAGLHYAHELVDFDGTPLGVVHRDLTPQNLFITYDGQVKVLDFGIAKVAGSLVETQVGSFKGKVRYMPAEQLEGAGVDRRADIFACGVILWETITGRRLWSDANDVAVVNAVLDGKIPSPREVAPWLDDKLTAICQKALAHRPEHRYQTAEALQLALEDYLSDQRRISTRDVGRLLSDAFNSDRLDVSRAVENRIGYASLARSSPIPAARTSSPPPSPVLSPLPTPLPGSLKRSAPPKPGRLLPREHDASVQEVPFAVVGRSHHKREPLRWLFVLGVMMVLSYLLFWQP